MRDGSDPIADWPFLNAMLNTASGASWVSIHNGGGVASATRTRRASDRRRRHSSKAAAHRTRANHDPALASRATRTLAIPKPSTSRVNPA